MMTENHASIVVPVYNRATAIVRCLDSIAMQRGVEAFSVIVVDNNSTDGSAAAVSAWHDAHSEIDLMQVTETRQGAAAARNKGLNMVTTPYVMFFDSDDEMRQGHLERLIKGIDKNPMADILGWNMLYVLPTGRNYLTKFITAKPIYNHLTRVILATENYAVKTDFIKKAGGWDGGLRGWDDYELGVRLLLCDPAMAKLDNDSDDPLVCPRFSEDSITGRLFSTDPGKWEKALDRIEDNLKEKCPEALYWVGYRRAVLAGMYAREGAAAEASRLLAAAPCGKLSRPKARICYEVTRLMGKGARHAAALMLPTNF